MKLTFLRPRSLQSFMRVLARYHLLPPGPLSARRERLVKDQWQSIADKKVGLAVHNGSLALVERVAVLDLRCTVGPLTKRLIELTRKHADGRVEDLEKHDGIGYKMSLTDHPVQAAKECLLEKVRLPRTISIRYEKPRVVVEEHESGYIFPIRQALRERHIVAAWISDEDHDPVGYRRVRKGKKVRFFWQPIKDEVATVSSSLTFARRFEDYALLATN